MMFAIPRTMLTIGPQGLLFASRHVLARMDCDGHLDIATNEERILALLSLAYEQPVPDWVLPGLKKAAQEWNRGNRGDAALRLILMGLADVSGDTDAMRKVAQVEGDFDRGRIPEGAIHELLKTVKGYNPNEPRDAQGRWTTGPEATDASGSMKPIPVQDLLISPETTLPWDWALPEEMTRPAPDTLPYPDALSYGIPNDLSDKEKKQCKKEWDKAKKFCKGAEAKGWFEDPDKYFGRSLEECMRGQVSAKCGGNPIA